jgi:small subunit ribosomal protein S20
LADEVKAKEAEAKKEAPAAKAAAPKEGAPAAGAPGAAAAPAATKRSSAEKAAKQALKHRARNKAVESGLKTFVHKAERLIVAKDLNAAGTAVEQALRALDRAAKKGIIHPNNAARRKSRLMHKLNVGKVGASKN